MAFDTNTLTAKGVELLASATAAIPIILDGCDATTVYVDQTTAIDVSARPTSPLSTTTDVSVIGATANHVMARAHFQAGTNTGGEARTLYLFGHAQNDPTNVYVIYVCSSHDTFHLPEADDVVNNYEALFDMIYSAVEGSVTTASTSVFCTLAEFNILKERVVTTHKEGDPNEGDPLQTVRGEKVFMDGIGTVALDVMKLDALPGSGYAHFGDDITVEGSAYINGGLNVNGTATISGDLQVSSMFTASGGIETDTIHTYNESEITIDGGLIVNGDIKPDAANTRTIGQNDNCFLNSYVRNSFVENIIPLDGATAINVNGSILPDTDDSRSLGSDLKRYENIYGHFLYTEAVGYVDDNINVKFYEDHPTYNNSVVVSCSNAELSIEATGSTVGCKFRLRMGSATPLKIEYNSSLSSYVITLGAPVANLQTTGDATVNGVLTVSGMTGTAPYYSSGRKVVVGSIIMAWKDAMTSDKHTGQTITQTDSSTVLYYCLMSANGPVQSSTNRLPNGSYALLCDCVTSACWVMVQCLSLD